MESGLTVMSGVSGVFSLGNTAFSIASAIQNAERWAALNRKLEQIQNTLNRMETRLEAIYGAVQWNNVVTRLSEPVDEIDASYKTITDLLTAAQAADFRLEEHRSVIDAWAETVLHPIHGIPGQLRRIDNAMRALTKEFSGDPLLKTFIGQVNSSAQSRYYGAASYFERWMLIQQKALICLGNAYMYRNPEGKIPLEFVLEDFIDLDSLLRKLSMHGKKEEDKDPLSKYLYERSKQGFMGDFEKPKMLWNIADRHVLTSLGDEAPNFLRMLLEDFNALLTDPSFYEPQRFSKVQLSKETRALINQRPQGRDLRILNRRLLAEAYPNEIARGRATSADASKFLEGQIKVDYQGRKVSMFEAQADVSKRYLDELDKYFSNTTWGDNEGKDFVSFSHEVFAVDTNELLAARGKAVVGLQLYRKGPRIALRIMQSPFGKGRVAQTGDHDGPGWVESGADTDKYFLVARKERNSKGQDYLAEELNHYVDMHATEVPDGQVVTGAALYLKGNRIAIKLQSTVVDPAGNLIESGRFWWNSPFMGNNDPADFVELRITPRAGQSAGDFRGVNIHVVQPDPLTPIRGAKLFLHRGPDSNRIAVAINPGLSNEGDLWKRADVSNIEDLWRKYDVVASTQAAALPALPAGQPQPPVFAV